ncbi:hypothetical protein J2W42_006641 [Rhizobium tibeticum]|nr:hypothetical protein [Rhizobium tibeticum]
MPRQQAAGYNCASTYDPSLKVSGFTLHERQDHRLWRCVAGGGKVLGQDLRQAP